TVMGKAEKIVEQKAYEKHKADEEQKGDDHAEDKQVVVPVSTTQKERPSLLQSTSNHSVFSNFGNQFINSPDVSFIGTIPENADAEINSLLDIQIQQDVPNIQQEPFHAVKVSITPKATQVPAPPQPATEIPSTQVSNSEVVKSVDVIEELVQAHVINEVKKFLPKFLPHAVKEALEKTPLSLELFDALIWSMLLDEANKEKGDKLDSVPKKRDRGDDQDKDHLARSNQGKKTQKRRFNESESSKKTSIAKELSKGKSSAKTSKSGKSMTAEEPKKDWFKDSPNLEVLNPDWNIVKIIDDAPIQPWFNEMVQAEKPSLTFDELMSTPIDFSAFAMNRLKLDNITREILVGPVFNLLKGTYKSCSELEYNMEECYRALTDQLYWANPEGHKSPIDMCKPLPLYDQHGFQTQSLSTMRILSVVSVQVEKRSRYGYLKEIVVRRVDKELYKFKGGDFSDLHLNDIEDMLLLIAQNKLYNLDGDMIVDFVTTLKMFT
ncbi:hypothetical protein Tco_1366515, partial [Tanacetum coccineum]